MTEDCYQDGFMLEALKEAAAALKTGEVPVGCVFVALSASKSDGKEKKFVIVGRGHNLTNARKNALEHAELVAISKMEEQQQLDPRSSLQHMQLYVTVEPCIMCASALLYRGIGKVFFGCSNPRFGGNGTILSMHGADGQKGEMKTAGYSSFGGYRAQEAIALLQDFYEQENPNAPSDAKSGKRRLRQQASAATNDHDDA